MGSSKFYLAVGFVALTAVPLGFTANISTTTERSTNFTFKYSTTYSITENKETATKHSDECKTCPDHSLINWLDNKVTLMGGAAVLLLGLLVSNMVLACCICSLRRRMSYWAITRIGNLTGVTEDRYVVGDAGLPADQAVELSTIYTMPDNTVREGNAEEAHKAEGATPTEADPANGDAQGPEQAEALLPEPPADVPEPADDVTDVLLVV